jgi:hypothetical protein
VWGVGRGAKGCVVCAGCGGGGGRRVWRGERMRCVGCACVWGVLDIGNNAALFTTAAKRSTHTHIHRAPHSTPHSPKAHALPEGTS